MNTGTESDSDLLRHYAEDQSEAAFGELVRRHVDLVYSAALRITREEQLARDVSQEVFVRLASNAGSLRTAAALPAWLYRVTHCQAVNAVRTEARRRKREQEAVLMNNLESETDTELAWAAVKPQLDEALGTLDRSDQAAIVLRFFSGKKLAEVGEALGVSEEASRKRLSRALERLRLFFNRRGVQVSSATLAAVLAAHSVQSAPAGMASTLVSASLAGAATVGSSGTIYTLTQTLLMTKTTIAIAGLVVIGAALTPWALKRGGASVSRDGTRAPGVASTPATATVPRQTPATMPAAVAGTQAAKSLLERVALLPPLTPQQISEYVAKNKGNAESLLAAWRASGDKAWLFEAAANFPNNPEVQYTVIAAQAHPETQRAWIEAYKSASPDNALAWYFSASDYLKTGDKARAVQELSEASRKPAFHSQLAATLQALEELNISSGRSADEAKVAAFQTCAQAPELPRLRDLAKGMKELLQDYRNQGDAASAESVTGMGLVLGAHLSDGYASQTIINQLVGMSLEKMFLQQLDPAATLDPFGRPVSEVSARINDRQRALKEYSQLLQTLLATLEDSEWSIYLERVKLYGEESALAWLKSRHGQ